MNKEKLLFILKKLNQEIDRKDLFPAYSEKAQSFVIENCFAFLFALCLDRGTKAEIIWSIPYEIQEKIGRLKPEDFYKNDEYKIRFLFNDLKYKPRYINDAPRTILELSRLVIDEYNGKSEKVWQGRSAEDVKNTLQKIHGVGEGIANMALLLIEKAYGPQFDDEDHKSMDIKPDVHTKRVLFRLGLAEQESPIDAILATRLLNPEYPGALDGPLWIIGKRWCHATAPDCKNCYVKENCQKRIH